MWRLVSIGKGPFRSPASLYPPCSLRTATNNFGSGNKETEYPMNGIEHLMRRRGATQIVIVTAFALLALCLPGAARAQWVTNGTNISNANPGNVGVGTTTPAQIFHVHSNGTYSGTRVTTAATGGTINDGVNFGYDDAYGAYIWNREASPIIFSTNDTERMRLNAAGNLGLGTTVPNAKFHVVDNDVVPDNELTVETVTGNYGPTIRLKNSIAGQNADFLLTATGAGNAGGAGAFRIYDYAADVTRFFIAPASGNVGIGTTAPLHKLDVGGNMSIGSGYTSSVMVPVNGLIVEGGVGIGTPNPSSQYKLDVAGDVRVSGNINAKYQDVAEWVPTTQKLSAGTVVVLDTVHDNHVLASSASYDTRVAGVISAQPGIALGEAGEGKVLVATTGRVKVRVDATSAPIKIGDLLVTGEREGYAMKSQPLMMGKRPFHSPGTIVGKALGSLEKGTGEILVLLSLQ
jgi:hypothetical protein